MTQMATAIEFERCVFDTLKGLNYRVVTEPPVPGCGGWQGRISSWLSERPRWPDGPDMAVAEGDRIILVEAKAYPILLGPVIQAGHYAEYYDAPMIICVPDEVFPQIPESVREWAEDSGIAISPIGEIGDRLKALLKCEETSSTS